MDKALQMISQHAEDGAKLRRDFFAAVSYTHLTLPTNSRV